jgi:hypothetical protein
MTGPVDSLAHKRFREVPPGRLRPEFVHPGCTNIGLPWWSERGLSDDEDRQHFICATWLHKAREMPKEFRREVEKELTLRETEATCRGPAVPGHRENPAGTSQASRLPSGCSRDDLRWTARRQGRIQIPTPLSWAPKGKDDTSLTAKAHLGPPKW